MSRLYRLGASIAAMAAGVALIAIPAKPASAAGIIATGWWYRASTANPTSEIPQPIPGGAPTVPFVAPAPPSVAEGELHVEGTARGATAIAAMTVQLSEGESSPVLTLQPSASSVIPPNALILACRAAVQWDPPAKNPGPWESKPLVDCATSVQGQLTDDGKLVFPLQTLVSGTLLDVVFVPGSDPALPADVGGSSFSLTFAKPGPEALATTSSGAAFTPTDDFGTSFDPAVESPLSGDVLLPGPVADPLPAPPVAPSLEPQEQAPSIPRVAPVAAPTPLDQSPRTLGLVLLFLGAVGAYFAANRAPRQSVGLGRFRRVLPAGGAEALLDSNPAEPAAIKERGLGRLRRPRVGAPPAL